MAQVLKVSAQKAWRPEYKPQYHLKKKDKKNFF
jgi:hypothetical protein